MGGGGSISPEKIDPRVPSKEKKTIGNWEAWQQDQLNKYIGDNPLVGAANKGALDFFGQVPSLTDPMKSLLSGLPAQFSALNNQYGGLFNQGQDVYGNLGGISSALGGIEGQLGQLQSPLDRLIGQSQGLFGQSGGLYNRLGNVANSFNPLINRSRALEGPLRGAYQGQIADVLKGGGALTKQMSRDVAQQTRQVASELGTAHGVGALGQELLNRDSAREARFKDYLGMGESAAGTLAGLLQQQAGMRGAQAGVLGQQGNVLGLRSGLLGQQGQLVGAKAGILGQQAGIEGQRAGIAGQQGGILGLLSGITGGQAGLVGQQAGLTQGLASGIQNLQTGGLNQLLGVQGGNVSGFTGLTNPILGYLGNLFGQNLQARIAQAQINEQAQAANSAASAGKAGGAMSSIGSIIGAIGPMIAMSDERLKRKIRDTGLTKDNVPLKTFEYKTKPGVTFLGVLSKDVKAKFPSAVATDPTSGVEFVDTRQFPIIQISALERKAA